MEGWSDGQIAKHQRVTGIAVVTTCAVCCEFLEGGGNPFRISANLQTQPFQNSRNHVAHVGRHDVSARVGDSLAPFAGILRSKLFPVFLENPYSAFTLVDVLAATECHRCHKVPSKTLSSIQTRRDLQLVSIK